MLLTKKMYEKPFENAKDALDAGLIPLILAELHPLYNESEHELWEAITERGKYVLNEINHSFIIDMLYRKKSIALLPKITYDFLLQTRLADYNTGMPKFLCLKEPYITYPISMFFPPNSYLRDLFEKDILRLQQAGLVNYWISQHIKKHTTSYDAFYNVKSERQVLTKDHLQGIFNIYMYMIVVSLVVFVGELLAEKTKKVVRFLMQRYFA
jgi:hypothetical protein